MQRVECTACGSEIEIPDDVLDGEIVSCPTCGLRYVVHLGVGLKLEEFKGEVEDYGE